MLAQIQRSVLRHKRIMAWASSIAETVLLRFFLKLCELYSAPREAGEPAQPSA
jgi:hypothetical protein